MDPTNNDVQMKEFGLGAADIDEKVPSSKPDDTLTIKVTTTVSGRFSSEEKTGSHEHVIMEMMEMPKSRVDTGDLSAIAKGAECCRPEGERASPQIAKLQGEISALKAAKAPLDKQVQKLGLMYMYKKCTLDPQANPHNINNLENLLLDEYGLMTIGSALQTPITTIRDETLEVNFLLTDLEVQIAKKEAKVSRLQKLL